MKNMISCFVSRNGDALGMYQFRRLRFLCETTGISAYTCITYHYDLATRTTLKDITMHLFQSEVIHDKAAIDYFMECAGNAHKLGIFIQQAYDYDYSDSLRELLTPAAQEEHIKACAVAAAERDDAFAVALTAYAKVKAQFESSYGKDCVAKLGNDHIKSALGDAKRLEMWARDAADEEYKKACARAWAELFKNSANRSYVWR